MRMPFALSPSVLLPVLLSLASLLHTTTASYQVDVKVGEKECFLIQGPSDRTSTLSGNYDCLNDEIPGGVVSAWVEDTAAPHKLLWISKKDATEGLFSLLLTTNQRVEFCVDVPDDNDDVVGDADEIAVGFNIHVQPEFRALPAEEIGPDAARGVAQVLKAVAIQQDWKNLQDHFDFLRQREVWNQDVTGRIMARVMGWTITEAVLVVGMAVAQVCYWRKFFEKRRYL